MRLGLDRDDLKKLSSPDIEGSWRQMHPDFMEKLTKVKRLVNLPSFTINSGLRSHRHNKKVGGVANSSHLFGRAADIHTPNPWYQRRVARAAVKAGFTRMGIGKNFIHIDDDPTKPQPAVWGYGGKKPPFNPFNLVT